MKFIILDIPSFIPSRKNTNVITKFKSLKGNNFNNSILKNEKNSYFITSDYENIYIVTINLGNQHNNQTRLTK